MTLLRFDWQREKTQEVTDGIVLNVGVNEDPANLKLEDNGSRKVINCDLFEYDAVENRPNKVDVLFDCARDTWPFEDDSVELVIMGDICEHLTNDEIKAAFTEARRVSKKLAITAPEDRRPETFEDRSDKFPRGAVHVNVITEELIEECFESTGWDIVEKVEVDYVFVPRGWFVLAERK